LAEGNVCELWTLDHSSPWHIFLTGVLFCCIADVMFCVKYMQFHSFSRVPLPCSLLTDGCVIQCTGPFIIKLHV